MKPGLQGAWGFDSKYRVSFKPGENKIKKNIDFHLALRHVERAAAAYNPPRQIQKQFGDNAKLTVKELADIDVLAFVERHDDQELQWVVVRGTANFENAKLDVEYAKEKHTAAGVPLHRGFSESADAVYQAIRPLLRDEYETRVTGHSLGGAIAAILMMRFHNEGIPLGQCITFGQPKVTDKKGVKRYRNLPLLRVVNKEDPVPLVPPVTLISAIHGIYRHFGPEVLLKEDGTYKYFSERQAERFDITSFWTHLGREDVVDHFVANYVTSLQQHCKS